MALVLDNVGEQVMKTISPYFMFTKKASKTASH